jgi:hypothetical protein
MAQKPPVYVETVRDLIYWLYSDLVSRDSESQGDFNFVESHYKQLKSGEIQWSSSISDNLKKWQRGQACAYCGEMENLSVDHIIPMSRAGIDPWIKELLDSPDNCVWACRDCHSEKKDRDIFEWYDKEHSDKIPNLVLSKFLKFSYKLHDGQGTLDSKDPNMDGVLDIYDLGVVITHLISKLSGRVSKV